MYYNKKHNSLFFESVYIYVTTSKLHSVVSGVWIFTAVLSVNTLKKNVPKLFYFPDENNNEV